MKILEFQTLSDADVSTILAALPLAFQPEFFVSPLQDARNSALVESLGKKLIRREEQFSANELAVLCTVVLVAQQYLAGKIALSVAPNLEADLRKYFFCYNKLAPSCEKTLEYLERSCSPIYPCL